MATHSSVLAWRIPGMGEPGGLPTMGSHRVGHDWSDLAAAAAFEFSLDPLGILGNEKNELPSTCWELSWAGLADSSTVTDGRSLLRFSQVLTRFRAIALSCFSVSRVSQPWTVVTHCLTLRTYQIIDCPGSNLHFAIYLPCELRQTNSSQSVSISLSVTWGKDSTYLLKLLWRLNELIYIKKLE